MRARCRDHEHAIDSGSPRSAAHDPRRAVHELFGQTSGVRAADEPVVRGTPGSAGFAFAGCFMLGAGVAFLSALLFSNSVLKGRARPMILELPAYQVPSCECAAHGAGPGAVVSQDRRHRDHGDLRGDVVAECVSEGRAA